MSDAGWSGPVPHIELSRVFSGYGAAGDVIRDISLAIQPGEFFALIGPNGCGKSTLLKALAGLLDVRSGSIRIKGRSLAAWSRTDLARTVAVLPQSRDLPLLDVETLVAHGRFPHQGYFRHLSHHDHRLIDQALATLRISHLRHASLRDLSGGERQKAYLAMLLAQDTEILLLDEPTTFLDPGFQLEILGCLHDLNLQGKTILMVLHDLNHALSHAHRVGLMAGGQLLLAAKPEVLFASGLIDRVFGITMKAISQDDQLFYTVQPAQPEQT